MSTGSSWRRRSGSASPASTCRIVRTTHSMISTCRRTAWSRSATTGRATQAGVGQAGRAEREPGLMQQVRLGATGLRVSRICLGMMSFGTGGRPTWPLGLAAAEPIVRRAVDAGVTFFDTADAYSKGTGEELTGRLLRKFFARREDYVLATQVYYPTGPGPHDRGLSRKHILDGIDAS